ncbi:MAG: helix-turn-helix domain-containing protein [Oscillospiraceae bacterium]|jgi:transcriptional regulator with XRE-family HTH domain|nr:helix-turn-helix domain-containing protein [Oscillospiraceae bacterium]
MTISISENLKKLRVNREITQEALAEHLGVSAQSVSKWERGENFPDLTLVPMIANYFDVSTDVLLGMDAIRSKKRVEDAKAKTLELRMSDTDTQDERLELWRELAHDMPHDYEVQFLYAGELKGKHEKWVDVRNFDPYKREAVQIYERILDNSTDDELRTRTIAVLCNAYTELRELDKARELAARLPVVHQCREWMGEMIAQKAIEQYLNQLNENAGVKLVRANTITDPSELLRMLQDTEATEKFNLAREKAMKSIDKATAEELTKPFSDALFAYSVRVSNALSNLGHFRRQLGLEQDGEYIRLLKLEMAIADIQQWDRPNDGTRYMNTYQNLALEYLKTDFDTALDYIVKAIECAAHTDPSLMAHGVESMVSDDGTVTKNRFERPAREQLAQMYERNITLDPFREHQRFINAMAKLKTDN